MNLLGNAERHGAPESPIEVRVWEAGGEGFVEVRKQGEPIPSCELVSIFEPFSQGAAGRDEGAGLGLGLHVCKEVAKAHGGDVRVESTREAGAAFTARLGKCEARGSAGA